MTHCLLSTIFKVQCGKYGLGRIGKAFLELGRVNSNATGKEERSDEHFSYGTETTVSQRHSIVWGVREAVSGPAEAHAGAVALSSSTSQGEFGNVIVSRRRF